MNSSVQVNSSIDLISKLLQTLQIFRKYERGFIIAEYGLINALEQEINKLRTIGLYHIIFEVAGKLHL
ncbi:MAG: hypothetical protein WDO19_22965 [Bacteroidota bacterium]